MLILQVCKQPRNIVLFSFVEISVKQACKEWTSAGGNLHSKSCQQQMRVVMHGMGGQHDSWGQAEAEAIHALTSLQDDSSLAPMSH